MNSVLPRSHLGGLRKWTPVTRPGAPTGERWGNVSRPLHQPVVQCSKRRRPGTPQPAQPDGAGGRRTRYAVRRSNLLPLSEAAGPDGAGGASSRETGPKPQRRLPQEAPLFTRGSSHFIRVHRELSTSETRDKITTGSTSSLSAPGPTVLPSG